MVGLGETRDELTEAFEALREVDCDILTIGQYLRPSLQHLPARALLPSRRIRRDEDTRRWRSASSTSSRGRWCARATTLATRSRAPSSSGFAARRRSTPMAGSSRSRADSRSQSGRSCHDGPVSVDFDPVKLGPRAAADRSGPRPDPGRRRRAGRRDRQAMAAGRHPESPAAAVAVAEVTRSVPPSICPDARSDVPHRRDGGIDRRPGRRPGPRWRGHYAARCARGVGPILVARRQNLGSGPDPRFQELWSGRRQTSPASRPPTSRATSSRSSRSGSPSRPMPRRWTCGSGDCIANDELEWIDARPLDPDDPVGAFTFVRSGRDGASSRRVAVRPVSGRLLAADEIHPIARPDPGPLRHRSRRRTSGRQTEANLVGPRRATRRACASGRSRRSMASACPARASGRGR